MKLFGMVDPMTGKRYDYVADDLSDHLLSVLGAACGDNCPPEGVEYLCEQVDAVEGTEAEVCAQCYRNWAKLKGEPTSLQSRRLMQAIELAVQDKCPPSTKDFLCQATEDEGTDSETCAACLLRWATLPFGKPKK